MTLLIGEVFLNLIERDRLWKTREGRVMLVDELERRHPANVLAKLKRCAPDLHLEWIQEFLDDGVTYRQLAEAGGRGRGSFRFEPAVGACRWLEAQPLVRRLCQLEAARPGGSDRR